MIKHHCFSYLTVQMSYRFSNSVPCMPLYMYVNVGETFILLAYQDRTIGKNSYVSLIISCENILIIFAYQFCNMLHPGNVIQEFLYFCLKQTLTLDPESTKSQGYDFDHGKSWGTSDSYMLLINQRKMSVSALTTALDDIFDVLCMSMFFQGSCSLDSVLKIQVFWHFLYPCSNIPHVTD